MNSTLSTSAGKDDQLIRIRELGRPDLLNCSRSTIYVLIKNDSDFRRLVPIIYLNSIPYAMLGDIAAYKQVKRRNALAADKPRVGRPRGKSRKASFPFAKT